MNYEFKNKAEYRRMLIDFADSRIQKFLKQRDGLKYSVKPIVYLESPQALETIAWIEFGYHPDCLVPVTRKVGEAAAITKRVKAKTGKSVRSLSGEVSSVVRRFSRSDTEPGAAYFNLDLTSCLSRKSLVVIMDSMYELQPEIAAVTILRGREKDDLQVLLNSAFVYSGVVRKTNNGRIQKKDFPFIVCVNDKDCALRLKRIKRAATPGLSKKRHIIFRNGVKDVNRFPLLVWATEFPRLGPDWKLKATNIERVYGRYKSSAGNQTMLFVASSRTPVFKAKFKRGAEYNIGPIVKTSDARDVAQIGF